MAPPGVQTLLDAIKKGTPNLITDRKLNFITLHYLYIGGMAFFWSGIFYAMGGVEYIDSLYFTSGACTQSGLNTIDVNTLNTGQQFLLYTLAMVCNPIFINTTVVFIRLYWFEKRFKDVVKEARLLRRTKSRPRQRRESMHSEDTEAVRSVRSRAIQLLRNTGHKADGRPIPIIRTEQDTREEPEKHFDSSDTSGDHQDDHHDDHRGDHELRQRRSSSLEDIRLPQQMNTEQQIEFLENQRNPKDNTTLHIPSPREFDRGGRVSSVDESAQLDRHITRTQPDETSPEVTGTPRVGQHITFNTPDVPTRTQPRHTNTFPRIDTGKASTLDPSTYDDHILHGQNRTRRGSGGFLRTNTARTMEVAPYLSYQPTVARNSFFVNLTEEQREELGGIEYRALKTLALILLGYFFLFHIMGILGLTPWIYRVSYGSVVTEDGQGRGWWGVFTAASAFNDLGFTLTPDSMISFQTATWPLLLMTFLIIIGNTGFPCMLRFVIWVLSKCVPVGGGLWEELQFLLDHPRRCFTLLFPRAATWWLFGILVILNVLDLFFFLVLDIHDDTVEALSGWVKFLVGLFQAASTRTAGFGAINLAELHPAIQVSYLIMMYISVFPIAISMRRTNVYEEKSLGIYASVDEDAEDGDPSYVGAHLRKQLGFDLWYVFLGLFIICIVEGSRIENSNDYAFTTFSILFEIVSAYGTVGLSLGYPTVNASFSSQFHVLSKLVIIAMQIRGRHRGLPYALDRAILLPSEGLQRKEAQEGERMLQRHISQNSYDVRQVPSRQPTDRPFTSATSYRSNRSDQTDENERHRFTSNRTATNTSADHPGRSHPMHRGLGVAMNRIVEAEDSIKGEAEHFAPHSG